ncbi:dihydrolipoamide acetyltransferase family protein [Gordonia sp. (in: high G+C Gram-positive bacteria)]|uniref:dihydrolipoamide acetyltransferase family protein n=1 Tax=Gordonia sp. (in: high G+C Gram-positive bacteria) TaxID=84139 RepID=UPI001696228F|nr:dihydrolipoamide acetyltransferase family protein [Gordonia sp. (in: high G+C Gram-positive bacteria)]NLG47385.1 2-oxo acid dehydrogenase subunit E2 [Gordonia sp. (in: high G+C Gram-positive bacteria)]
MPVIETFNLPDLGEGLTDAELVTWSVAVGDVIELNQEIAEVETAKASVELPSPYAGTVVKLHVAEGATLDVGSPLIDVEVADGAETGEEPAGRTPVLVGYGVAEERAGRRRRKVAAPEPAAPAPTDSGAGGSGAGGSDVGDSDTVPSVKPLAAPPVRKLARERGVDLTEVTATGSSGQVTRDDLERHEGAGADAVHSAPSGALEERTPIRGVRRRTADAMVRSAFTAPHVTEFVDVDVTPMMDLVAKLTEHKRFDGVRITPLALVAKALLVSLRGNPSLNSTWDDATQEIVTKRYVNLGIAAATPRGLMVPNIKNAHELSLRDLAERLSDLTALAKAGTTPPADLVGGTISITNVGVFGVDAGTPILNPGEAAILCFGAVRRRPWEWQGEIALREVTTLSLSFDHRLVDGEQGSKFLATVAEVLADPLALIALS